MQSFLSLCAKLDAVLKYTVPGQISKAILCFLLLCCPNYGSSHLLIQFFIDLLSMWKKITYCFSVFAVILRGISVSDAELSSHPAQPDTSETELSVSRKGNRKHSGAGLYSLK